MPPRFGRVSRSIGKAVLVLAVLLSALLLLWMEKVLPWPQRTIALGKIRATEGYGFTAKLPAPWPGFAFIGPSGVLTEDGRELTRVNENGLVREQGRGAFRVGGERVLFSTSDGSDPLKNGRAYSLRVQTVVAPWLRTPLLCGGGLALLLLLGKNVLILGAWLRRSVAESPPVSARAGALWLFAGALAIRVGFVWLNPEYTDGQMSIQGIPYSDAGGWNAMAKSTALGRGVDSAFPGMRALYPMFLANFYTWFGPSLPLAKALQAVIGAATAAVIFLALRRAMPLWPALAAALFFALDPRQFTQAAKLMTEPLGLLLTLLSAWCLIVGGERRRPALLCASGAFLACSNLTRPLTLFAFPIFVALVAVHSWLRETPRWRAAAMHSAAFALGTVVCLAPWVIRERVTHGIWAISSNSSSALFAASTPEFGTWATGVEALAGQAGIPYQVKARFVFFQERFRENLKQYPGFYAANVRRSFGLAALGCENISPALSGAGLGALGILAALAARRGGAGAALGVALPGSIAVLILVFVHAPWAGVFALIGAAFTLWWRWFPGAVLIVCHLGALLGSALFGNPDLQRMRLLADWLEAGWMFAGMFAVASAVAALLLRAPFSLLLGASREGTDEPPPRALRWLGWAFSAFLLVSSIRLVVLNVFTTHPARPNPQLTDAGRSAFLQELAARFPAWQRLADPALMSAPRSWQRRVFVEFGTLDREVYRFPAGVGVQHWQGLFEPRSYEHNAFVFQTFTAPFAGGIWMELAAQIPPSHLETPCLLIGLAKVRPVVTAYYPNSVEAVAIVPAPAFQPDFTRAIVAPIRPETEALLDVSSTPP